MEPGGPDALLNGALSSFDRPGVLIRVPSVINGLRRLLSLLPAHFRFQAHPYGHWTVAEATNRTSDLLRLPLLRVEKTP